MREAMGFGELFDRLYFSCELGYQKPDEGYFRHVQRSLGLDGESILFWDDAARNVDGARECGWHAEVYTGFEDFEERLRKYLPGVGGLGRVVT
jgi:putative hydrolase of the HAD superfamily